MNITHTRQDQLALVKIEGRLDAATAAAAEKQLVDLVAAGARSMAVDGSALAYISSAGLRVLLSLAKKIKAAQGRIALGGLQPQVKEILEIAGFSSIMPVHATAEEARRACED
jgi:stage II sporulation protein AA (anti-sigma F factor antagonist)